LVTIAGSFLAGWQEGVSAASGAGIAILALSVSPVLHLICRNLDPALSLGFAVLAYCLVILGMWVAYEQLGNTDWLDATFAAWGVLFTGIGWVAGHMRGALKLRVPLYEEADRRD
jgi:multisubunit Na+/H+ antiporter MnhB subunit